MTNRTNRGRQEILALEQVFDFSDLNLVAAGVAIAPAPKLPVGAIVVMTQLHIETAFNGTTPTISVGRVGALTQYFNATSGAAGVTNGSTGLGIKASGETLQISGNAGAVASTAGKGRLVIEYMIEGKADEVQP